MANERKYDDSYVKFGFTSLNDHGVEKGQCVVCYRVLSNESLRPSKLKNHLEKNHPELKDKSIEYFKRLESNCKRQRLDKTGNFQQTDQKLTEASFVVSQIIAKQKKPHNIAETVIKPSALAMTRIVLGDKHEKSLKAIPLSNHTVKRRIAAMSEDIKEQVITEINKSAFGLFTIQLDESVDVSSVSQLMVFVRYAVDTFVKEEILFCCALNTSTKASDVMEKVDHFFNENGISWNNLCGVCTDGAAAMLGSKSGFQALVQTKATGVMFTHCFIHREALASKTLPSGLQDVLNITIKTVNFVKNSALHTRLFRKLCEDMESEHKNLLYYTKVRWLSKGNVLCRVFDLRYELEIYLTDVKPELAFHFANAKFIACLAYLVDIFHSLNTLNLKMQGKEKNIIQHMDLINAFVEKLANWRRKAQNGNFAMFNNLSDISELNDELKTNIVQHLKELESEFQSYFPEISADDLLLARNPFRVPLKMWKMNCKTN